MPSYEKAFIYFDTNSLECRHSGKSLYLSQFTVNPLYYEVEDLIQTMGLSEIVEICIPDIVWLELKEHLIKHYKSEKSSMEDKIDSCCKSFGNLAEIAFELKDCRNEFEYMSYADEIAQNFLDNPRVNAKIVSSPKDEVTIDKVIYQAIHSVQPFKTAKVGGKVYTDAGFKDVLIFNTILKHTGNQLGIFISNDKDYLELFDSKTINNLRMCNSSKDVQRILLQEFNIVTVDMMETLLKTNDYLMRRILSDCEIEQDAYISNLKIKSCETMDDNMCVSFVALVNGQKYNFDIVYNMSANELLEAHSDVLNADEEEIE